MIYLGNFIEYIEKAWISAARDNRGIGRPAEGKSPDSNKEREEYQKAIDAGYSIDNIYFYMFTQENFPYNIKLPFIQKPYHWWITKMMPGNFMPIHVDPHTTYQKDSERYWMPLQDYEPGHVFLYEDNFITNYKAGDLFRYTRADALHGAANIGYNPRLVLQISTYSHV